MLVNYHPGPECSIHWAARTVTRGEDVLMRKREKNNGWRVKDVKVSNYWYYRGRNGLYVHIIWYALCINIHTLGDASIKAILFACILFPACLSGRRNTLLCFIFLFCLKARAKLGRINDARDSESAVNTTALTPRFSRLVEDCPTIYVTCTCSLNTWLKTKWKYAVDMTMALRSKLTAHMGCCDVPGICEA